jgi:cobalt-zinc-cadmium efflux system membrane fusion protein
MKKQIASLCLMALYACGNHIDNNHAEHKQFAIEGEYITVGEDSPLLQNIRIQAVETTDYRATFTAPGVVQAIPSRYAEIASPFVGRIAKTFVRLGQKVSPGSPVFEISSPDFFEASKAYYQAEQEMELALKNLNRERDLLANRVGAAKELEEAEVNYEIKKKDYEHARAAVGVYQIADPVDSVFTQSLIVRSPIAGRVVKDRLVIGQYIREDADALVVVADLDKVWVSARVRERDIALIDAVDAVDVTLPSLPAGEVVAGEIFHVGEWVDEETRSVEVIIECDNRERRIKPFMYGTVHFTGRPAPAVVVPNSAVLQDEDRRYVLVSEGNNRFRKATIDIAETDGQQTVIRSGAGRGDSIVTEGAFYFIDAR